MRAAWAAGMVLALAGCTTVGPNYQVPAAAVVRASAAQGDFVEAPTQTTAKALPPRWWHLYNDPVLDGLEAEALAANTDLRSAAANLARAKALSAVTETARQPDVNIDAAAERARLSGESYLLTEPLPAANLGNVGIEMSYQVDLFGRIRRSIEAAHADAQAVEATRDAVQVTVAAEVARAYIGLCSANEGLDLGSEGVALQQRRLTIAQRLMHAGRGSALEVTDAQGRIAQAEAAMPSQRAAARVALYRLAFLTGHVPADAPHQAEACRHIPTIKGPLPVGDGAALLRRRPDIRVAERQLAAATARIGVATADLYPSIGFGLGAGSSGFLSDLGQAAANSWNIGSLIHWSLPGAGVRARIRAENAASDAALARFDGTVLAALRETETVLATYAQDKNRAKALADTRILAERSAAQIQRLRAAGRTPLLAEVGGQQGVLSARIAEQNTRHDLANDQISLFLALGGGW